MTKQTTIVVIGSFRVKKKNVQSGLKLSHTLGKCVFIFIYRQQRSRSTSHLHSLIRALTVCIRNHWILMDILDSVVQNLTKLLATLKYGKYIDIFFAEKM